MAGAWLIIGLAAGVPAAAGASILIVACMVCQCMQKGGKKKKKKKGGGAGMYALWPSMNDRFEGSITKRIKASNSVIKEPSDNSNCSLRQSSKMASAWRASFPIKAFHWHDHPGLVADAVEHGWSTFAFSFPPSDSPLPASLWSSCVRFSHLPSATSTTSPPLSPPEIAWEVNAASSEYMQKIRLNPDFLLPHTPDPLFNGPISTIQSLQTTLPLPGPPLGPLSFPQEGYYEITVFGLDGHRDSFAELSHTSLNEHEHAQLIDPRRFAKRSSGYIAALDAPSPGTEAVHKRPSSFGISISISDLNKVSSAATENGVAPQQNIGDVHSKEESIDGPALQSAANEQQICAIGLAAGSAPPFRLPGSDAASVGFFSNGRVFMNGQEQKKPDGWRRRIWGPVTGLSTPTTVGCGFNPEARRLFFTLNGEMVEEILLPPLNFNNAHGDDASATSIDKSMEFTAYPLFPTIGANYSITVTANFGQAAFAYAAANAQRVPNPCFRRQMVGTKGAGEDSADLFSMGRIDSQWLADLGGGGGTMGMFGSPARGNGGLGGSAAVTQPATSEVVEGDLFEITLDSRTL